MENLKDKILNKYQVTIYFEMDDQFMTLVPPHRVYINDLIEKNIIDSYAVSLESHRSWITINADGVNFDVQTPAFGATNTYYLGVRFTIFGEEIEKDFVINVYECSIPDCSACAYTTQVVCTS